MGYIREGPDYRALVRATYTIPTTSLCRLSRQFTTRGHDLYIKRRRATTRVVATVSGTHVGDVASFSASRARFSDSLTTYQLSERQKVKPPEACAATNDYVIK